LGTVETQPGSEANSYFCKNLLSQVRTGVLNNCDGYQRLSDIWTQHKASVISSHVEHTVNMSNQRAIHNAT